MERDTRITVRLPLAVRKALEAAAAAERRSVSDLAVLVLTDWLTAQGHLAGPAAPRRKGR